MKKLLFFLFMLRSFLLNAQTEPLLISGPMLGYCEHRSVLIWFEFSQEVNSAQLRYWENSNSDFFYEVDYSGELGRPYNPAKFELVKLKPNTTYKYELLLNGKIMDLTGTATFSTKPHQANPTADPAAFSFLAGSCAYLNDPVLDQSNMPYGQDPYIFKAMSSQESSFMLWLGDNLYLRSPDYSSEAGIRYRYSMHRRSPAIADLLASRPNYAIWDDHDYGYNDADRSFELKNVSRDVFASYWGNKSYGGENDKATYSAFSWSDADFFLMDDRSQRAPNRMQDSLNGKPNCDKAFFGPQQLSWLKDKLLSSTATFKFIAVGNQVLNPVAQKEHFRNYSCEFNDLMSFIATYKVEGVVFLTGDRHFTEVNTYRIKGGYTLFDFTCSPLTSRVHEVSLLEKNNPARLQGSLVALNNFCRFEISGPAGDRTLKMQSFDKNGTVLFSHSLSERELKMK